VKGVKLRRRMPRSLEIQARDFGVRRCPRRNKNISHNHHRRVERDVSDRQRTWGLRRNHALAAIVTLIGWIAGHRTATLHTLLILRRRGHAVGKLQTYQGDQGHEDEYLLAHCPISTLDGLDARFNERIQRLQRFAVRLTSSTAGADCQGNTVTLCKRVQTVSSSQLRFSSESGMLYRSLNLSTAAHLSSIWFARHVTRSRPRPGLHGSYPKLPVFVVGRNTVTAFAVPSYRPFHQAPCNKAPYN
jgi:hypothetical protein